MLSLLITAQCLVSSPEPPVLDAQDPKIPALIFVASPKGVRSHLPTSVYLDEAALVFSAHTSVALQSAEQAGIDPTAMLNCPFDRRLSCWAAIARKAAQRTNRYLFVLIVQKVSDGDRIAPFFIDLELADQVASESAVSPEDLEDRMFDVAIQPTPGRIDPGDRKELSQLLGKFLRQAFRETLDRNRHWEPYGTIELRVDAPGATLELDGRLLGLVETEHTRIVRVLPGERRVGVRVPAGHPTLQPFATEEVVIVAAGSEASAELDSPPSRQTAWRPALMVAGAATFLAGSAILAVAGARATDELAGTCVVRAGQAPDCPDVGGARFGYAGAAGAPSFSVEDVNQGGVSMAAVGAGLAVMGATWTLGTWLFGDAEDLPWIQLGTGIAAGATTVGVGMALDRQ